jgi:hypothetical protein
MKSKRAVLAMGGLAVLASLGFLLPKRSDASGAVPVQVVNKPTVTVGNTANVSVANTPNVNVANAPSVSVSSMPPVQMSGSVSVENSLQAPLYVTASLATFQVGGSCVYPQGSSTCEADDVYEVPSGLTAIVTNYSGACGVIVGDYATAAAQLFISGAGPTQTLTTPATTGGQEPFEQSFFGQYTNFYAPSGSTISAKVLAYGIQNNGSNCIYTISGSLAPSASSSATRK